MKLNVWSPHASSLDALIGGARLPLEHVGEYWSADLPEGTEYLLSVDGGPGFPDPRSRFQPHGVHGPSQALDLDFEWSDASWDSGRTLGTLWYELHVGTFTPAGTLDSAIAKLPHLAELGVGVVELMPLAAFPGARGWGYDGVALFAVHEAYGGPSALQRFVDAAHGLGLAVALDVVYNHLGPAGNYLSQFGPYFTDAHETPWGWAVNLDTPGAHGMREFILDNARYWFEQFHIDALRLDAVHALLDDSDRHILAELADATHKWQDELGRTLTLVAESDENDPRTIAPTSQGGRGMDGQWADDVHHALHSYLTGETFGYYVDFGTPQTLAKAFRQVFVHDGDYSTFRGKRWGSPLPDGVDMTQFVTFTQNHDQVGNRGLGDRPDERLPRGAVMAGAALLLLGPFTPMLFQGQEWGTTRPFRFFTDHDGDLGKAVSEGRLTEFAQHGWEKLYGDGFEVPDPQSETTFLDSKLDWEAIDPEVLAAYRELIELRSLIADDSVCEPSYGDGWFRIDRGRIAVVTHAGAGTSTHDAPGELLWSWGPAALEDGVLTLGPHAVAVVRP
ncbi:maltooligosyl trehalose hydrolase [Ruaniaceae bacterium KH17]|nr:maltooligosyl trehalose hydrolase [Ruaniaceae bacterium KH17]